MAIGRSLFSNESRQKRFIRADELSPRVIISRVFQSYDEAMMSFRRTHRTLQYETHQIEAKNESLFMMSLDAGRYLTEKKNFADGKSDLRQTCWETDSFSLS